MTTTYTDATPPVDYTSTEGNYLNTGLAAQTTGGLDRVSYALYEDTDTWTAWTTWAELNAYDGSNWKRFSSRALQIKGRWESLEEGNASFMCIADDASATRYGAMCMEAAISGTTYAVNTYSILDADLTTKLDTSSANVVMDLQDFAFVDTTVTTPAATAVSVGPDSPDDGQYHWQSFDVANCELVSPEINCINWVASDATTYTGVDWDRDTATTDVYDAGQADGGYRRWTEGDNVKFYWFDGRQLDTLFGASHGYDKFVGSTVVTLVYDAGALQGLVASTLAITASLFMAL